MGDGGSEAGRLHPNRLSYCSIRSRLVQMPFGPFLCNVRDRDGGLPRPRGRFLCLTVILKRKCYNEVRKKRLLDPHLVGETSSTCIPVYADDALAWVTALSGSCRAAAADFTEGRWTRFTIHLADEKLEELLRIGTLQGLVIDANGWEWNCCKDCCAHDGTYYRPRRPASSQDSIRDPEAARGPSPGARSPTEGEGPQGQQEQQGQQGDGQPGAPEQMPKRRRRWGSGDRALVDRERKAPPLMPPPGAQCPQTEEEARRAWDQAAAFLCGFVPNEFWTLCENMWIEQNLRYRVILKEYNAAWGLRERKSLKKHVSYWGAVKLPEWAMLWSDPTYPGYSDVGNDVYAAVFRRLWPKSHICRYASDTIGDFIEALLGWYIYWTTKGAEFDEIVHLVVEHLNTALLSAWVLRTFYF